LAKRDFFFHRKNRDKFLKLYGAFTFFTGLKMKRKDTQQTVLKMDGIGDVCFVWNRNSRNLRISMTPFQGVRVTVPSFITLDYARQFVEEKRAWIRKHTERMAEKEKGKSIFTPERIFKTRDHTLYLHTHEEKTIRIIIKSGGIHIFYPAFAPVEDQRVQRAIRKGITEAWRIEAGKHLPQRLKELASAWGFSCNRITFRNNKTRWGSCSRDNNISLHIQLMRLPGHLTDYIILHELVHTVHKNHGKQYWQLLDKVTGGNARKLDKEMNDYRLEIW
jgi:predicted metal-dependent hydrolase